MSDGAGRPFYEEAYRRALPHIEAIRTRLPHFSSPVLRVQRVGQLDADLLDQELAELLAEPVKAALRNVSPTTSTRHLAEIYVLLRLVLYKFSIFDRGATYGAMLQNLKYRNEWAHTSSRTSPSSDAVQSTARDAPLRAFQLGLYPILTILVPYAYQKSKTYMAEQGYADAPSDTPAFLAWSLAEQGLRVWNVLALLNFAAFLYNGKYRTIADRLLGMRLIYANRALNRNVSFEFLNRQLVWNAFTVCTCSVLMQEFLLFLLPLIRPQRLLKRLARLPTSPAVLAALHGAMPAGLAKRIGLHKDRSGRVRLGTAHDRASLGRYYNLPEACCALCFQRLERAAGVEVDVRAPPQGIRAAAVVDAATAPAAVTPPPPVTIPTIDPLHPSKGLAARRRQREKHEATQETSPAAQRAAARAAKVAARRAARRAQDPPTHLAEGRPSLLAASPNGIKYLDALATTPYETLPCADSGHTCVYCYYCIAEKLLSENMADELHDQGGWTCLRCGQRVWGARRRDDSHSQETHATDAPAPGSHEGDRLHETPT